MRPVVRERWIAFTEAFEGGVPYLYADIRNLITIAYGNLVDPLSVALSLPLMHPGGVAATKVEITSAWLAVKGDPNAASRGHGYARGLTSLRLTREGMGELALGVLGRNDAALRKRLPDWDDYPACAQMAFHSLAWACGAGARYPRLLSAAQARNWDACSVEIHINEWTPEGIHNKGLIPRNIANKILMRNAQRVDAYRLDYDVIDWVHVLGVQDADTVPEIVVLNTPLPLVNTPIMEEYPHTGLRLVESTASQPTRYPKPDPEAA